MLINKYATSWKDATEIPTGIKNEVRWFFRNISISTLAVVKQSSETRFLRALFCHYVFDDQKDQFQKIITALKQLGDFIDTDTCLDLLDGRKELNHRYFHLSFDDGFRNNFTNAFPILHTLGVPAIFFVPSSLVGADWDKTRKYCLEDTRYRGVIEMVRWEDLDQMQSGGYEIGSHTRTHTRFSTISKDIKRLEDEICGSKREIEEKLGKECKYISWPYCTQKDADEVSLDMSKQAGYHACFGAFRGTIIPMITNKFSIPRHHFEAEWPASHIKFFAKGNFETS